MSTTTVRLRVAPAVLRWARLRSGRDPFDLAARFPQLPAWERGDRQPTLKQLEAFANATHVPFGALFLDVPPTEALPIADFRSTQATAAPRTPSGDLLDTIYLCQQRQAWLAEELQTTHAPPSPFISRHIPGESPIDGAARARAVLRFEVADRPTTQPPERAFALLGELAEDAGILVMVSGVVGSHTQRKLSVDEFRGLALLDTFAPLVFVNGVDAKTAQLFTLAHELGHLWRGESAVSAMTMDSVAHNDTERWCDAFASELLVPRGALASVLAQDPSLVTQSSRLARRFAVSEAVALRALYDAGHPLESDLRARLRPLLARRARAESAGGDFYATLFARVSRRFARELVVGTLERRIPYTRALRLLGVSKLSAFDTLANKLGLGVALTAAAPGVTA